MKYIWCISYTFDVFDELKESKCYYGGHAVDWAGYVNNLEPAFESISDLEKGLKILRETYK